MLAVPALAAQPKAGCWGTCGGDLGPLAGFFQVANDRIEGGVSAEFRCLGLQKIPQPVGPPATEGDTLTVPRPANSHSLPPALKISHGGHFSYRGYGERFNGSRTSKVRVDLSGEFVSPTKALLSFGIAYGKCGTRRLTIRHVG